MSASMPSNSQDSDVTPVSRQDSSALAVSVTRARLALVQNARRGAIYEARTARGARTTDPGLGLIPPARAQLDTLPDSGAPAPRPEPPKSVFGLVVSILVALGTLAAAVQQLVSALGH